VPRRRYSALAKQLIDAGVASKYVNRLREELEDHRADLEEEGRRADKPAPEARRAAIQRLGHRQIIVDEFCKRPELKAWVYRSSFALCVIRLVALVLLTASAVLAALSARRSGLTRLISAAGAAFIVTATMLLSLSLVTSGEWSRRSQSPAPAEPLSANDPSFDAMPQGLPAKPPPIHISLPDPIQEYAAKLRAVAWSTDVSIDIRPGPIVFPRLTDGEYQPIVKVAPSYPAMAASMGIEGYVVVEFTVTRSGAVKDVVVIESSDELFVEAAVQATYKIKYKPRVIDGEPVEVSGVRNRVTFEFQA
jgi:protein TonB